MNFPILIPEDRWFLGAAMFLWLIMAWYYLFRFTAAGSKKYLKREAQMSDSLLPVSVIICAHNELENLKNNLPLMLTQRHPEFEIIVVDDGSWDGTAAFLREMQASHPALKVCTVDRDRVRNPGKKLAITLGVKAAKYEHLLLTDADCVPASTNWIHQAAAHFQSGASLLLGFSPYRKMPGFLNLFIRYETLITGMQYLSMALHKKAYMGVGRNLGYSKELFFKVKGFASNHHLPAGDDDLFVQDAANSQNTAVMLLPETHMPSIPKTGFMAWWKQKKRHLFVGRHYHKSVKLFLGVLSFSQILFYALTAIWFFLTAIWWLPLAVYGLWLLLRFVVVARCASVLKQMQVLWAYPLLDLCHTLFLFFAGMNAWFAKRINW